MKKMFLYFLLIPFFAYSLEFFPVASFEGGRPVLLRDGVGYYYEKTRPPTQEEVEKRLEWFEREWAKLKEKEPEFYKALSEGEEKLKKEFSKSPPVFNKFFMAAFKLIGLIAKEGMKAAQPLAREYFSKAPVVVEAGFIVKNLNGSSYTLKIDYGKVYKEEWKRMPSEGVYPVSSLNGLYLALITEDDFGTIKVYKLDNKKLELIFETAGTAPIAFSPSGKYLAYSTLDRSSIVVVDTEGNLIRKVAVEYKVAKKKESPGPVRIALSEKHLGIISWIGVKVVGLDDGSEREIRLRGGKSIIFNSRGDKLFASITPGELYIYNVESLKLVKKVDYFSLRNKHKAFFTYISSVSPDDRFLAGLYDPTLIDEKAPPGKSVLVIYDLQGDIVIQRIENLEDITGGFAGVFIPASFSPDWNYLLVYKKGNKIELFKRR